VLGILVVVDVAALTSVVETVGAVLVEETKLLELDPILELEVTVVVDGAVLLVCVVTCPAVGNQDKELELRSTITMSMKILRFLSILDTTG
jgi:hypothetical protein